MSKHRRVPLAERPLKESKCKIHPQQSLILYCRNEKVVICEHCHKYGDHQKHDAILLQDLGMSVPARVDGRDGGGDGDDVGVMVMMWV